jgi:hypothetical protein
MTSRNSRSGAGGVDLVPGPARIRDISSGRMGHRKLAAGGRYVPAEFTDWRTLIEEIRRFAKSRHAAIIATITGDANLHFFRELARRRVTADTIPVMSLSINEAELPALMRSGEDGRQDPPPLQAGHDRPHQQGRGLFFRFGPPRGWCRPSPGARGSRRRLCRSRAGPSKPHEIAARGLIRPPRTERSAPIGPGSPSSGPVCAAIDRPIIGSTNRPEPF